MDAKQQQPKITAVRTFMVAPNPNKSEGDKPGQWLYHQEIANPMSRYAKYKGHRESWGIDVLRDFCVEIEAESQGKTTKGFAIGHGGLVGCFLAEEHFKRFLLDADPRDTTLLWDQMYRASQHYGRRGLTMMVISVIDLALWDLLGKLRGEPVYKLIGGKAKDTPLRAYCTGPHPDVARQQGFWGSKVPLCYGPNEPDSLQRNYDALAEYRKKAGPGFPLMVDCYMSLNIPYAIKLISKCADLDIEWWEEVLGPEDVEGYAMLRQALPQVKWATGEHEYTRYGYRRLIESRQLDVLQPDVMWCGGLTELLRIAAHAAAYDIDLVPHGTSHYTVHFCVSQPNAPLIEYVAYAPDGRSVAPVNGDFFVREPLPQGGVVPTSEFDKPGFGLEISPHVRLVPAEELLKAYYDIFGKQL